MGYVGSDPEVRKTSSGITVANFSLGVTEKWKHDGKEQERTEWVRVTAWDKLGDIVSKYVTKGSPLYIEGRMRTDKYKGKDGVEKYSTSITLDVLNLLGSSRAGSGDGAPAPSREGTEGDLPF